MSTKELLDEWEANRDRPAWVQQNSDRLEDVADVELPTSRAGIEDWLATHAHVVTRRLREAVDDETDAEPDADQED